MDQGLLGPGVRGQTDSSFGLQESETHLDFLNS